MTCNASKRISVLHIKRYDLIFFFRFVENESLFEKIVKLKHLNTLNFLLSHKNQSSKHKNVDDNKLKSFYMRQNLNLNPP